MRVHTLSVTDFRNYARASITLGDGVTVFLGPNGQGKTNIVEAIHYLSSLSSHRIAQDAALIKKGADQGIIRAEVVADSRSILLELELNRSKPNRAQVNQNPAKIRDFPRYFATVLFAPEDLQLVRGEPEQRRNFLDDLIVAFSPRLAGTLSDYDRVVKQRNTLLKSLRSLGSKKIDTGTLSIWDDKLIDLATEIVVARDAVVQKLVAPLAANYLAIAGVDHGPRLRQKLSIESADDAAAQSSGTLNERPKGLTPQNYKNRLRALIAGARDAEIERGASLYGPHRDDLEFELNDLPTKGYASHGETWSFILSLKLASAEILKAESPLGDPVIILDDVFAELDAARRKRLAERILTFEQCLITCAVAEDLPSDLQKKIFNVRSGTVIEA
jgi:DNA replication and repair protein RecF